MSRNGARPAFQTGRFRPRRSCGLAKFGMSQAGKPKPSPSRGTGRPRFALPSELRGSLRHLDDAQLERLLRAVVEEAGRRGRPIGVGISSPPHLGSGEASKHALAAAARKRAATTPISPGQAKIIQAAFDAGVKPATIARQFRVSRAQVAQIVGRPKQS